MESKHKFHGRINELEISIDSIERQSDTSTTIVNHHGEEWVSRNFEIAALGDRVLILFHSHDLHRLAHIHYMTVNNVNLYCSRGVVGVGYRGVSKALRRFVTNYYSFCPPILTNSLDEEKKIYLKRMYQNVYKYNSLPFARTSSTQ